MRARRRERDVVQTGSIKVEKQSERERVQQQEERSMEGRDEMRDKERREQKSL